MINKKILITGGAGSIGSELVRQLATNNKVYLLDFNETAFFDLYEEMRLQGHEVKGRVGDIRDVHLLEDVFLNFKPEIVFHAAALKHVTPSENDPDEPVKTNILGTSILTRTAHKFNVEKLINISTDKAVGDTIMGLTKRIAERIVKNAGYISVRFGNVLGSRGSVIPIWQKQIDEGKPITITDERMERYFMSIEEACTLVIAAAEVGKAGEIIILDMGKRQKVLDVALGILGKLNKTKDNIKIIGTRPGEAFIEKIMTPEEEQRAIKKGNYWII